jgi:hypothetical protein
LESIRRSRKNALNHTIGGVRGVYNRAEYAKQRREMLQFWSDYLDRLALAADLLLSPPKELRMRPVLAFSRVA